VVAEYRPRKTFPQQVVGAPFHVTLRLLWRVVERTGVAVVGPRSAENGFQLGLWVLYHRTEWRAGPLSYSRVQAFERLPGWSWHPYGDTFPEGIKRLRQYAAREGHTRVPSAHVEHGFLLGRWVGMVRTRYRRGLLKPDKARLLEELPGWRSDLPGRSHDKALAALRQYVKAHGHARVPARTVVDRLALGTWIGHRRHEFQGGRLVPLLEKLLEALPGWTWRLRSRSPLRSELTTAPPG
jgi:hypothetical protein